MEAIKDISGIYIEKAANKIKAIVSPIVKTGKNILNSTQNQLNKFIKYITPKKKQSIPKATNISNSKSLNPISRVVNKISKSVTSMIKKVTSKPKASPKPKASIKSKYKGKRK